MKSIIKIAMCLALIKGTALAAGNNAFEFRTPQSNTTQGTMDNNGNTVIYGSMTVLNALNVATGTFVVAGGSASFGSGTTRSTFTTTGNLQLVSGSTLTSNGTFSISTAASASLTGVPSIHVNNLGQVGIGTSRPSQNLSIGGSGANDSGLSFVVSNGSEKWGIANVSNVLQFQSGATGKIPMKIQANDSVSIGDNATISTFTSSGVLQLANVAALTPLFADGSNAIVSAAQLGNGGLLIGTGGAPSTGTISGNAVVTVTNGAGTIALSLNSSSATLQGNVFNGSSQLIQTTSGGLYPALSGANIINLTPANVSNGTLPVGVTISTGNVTVGQFGDNRISVSTGAIAAGQFEDNRVSISTGAVAAGQFGDNRVAITTGALTGTLPVNKGGTGDATLTSNGILLGNGTNAVNAATQMGNGGLLIGTGGTPSTGTISGNAAVTVTNAAGSISLSLNSSSATLQSNTFNGTLQLVQTDSAGRLPALDASNLTNVPNASNAVAYPYMGVNYRAWGGTLYSTGTSSFHISASTLVFNNIGYAIDDTSFSMVNSSFSIVTWNPTDGFRKWGTVNFEYSSISSFTAIFNDDIVVAASSSGVTGTVSTFDVAWSMPEPGVSFSRDSGAATSATKSKSALACSTGDYYSCNWNTLEQMPVDKAFGFFNDCTGAPCEEVFVFTVFVDSATSSTIRCLQNSNTAGKVSFQVNNGGFTDLTNLPDIVSKTVSGNAYSLVILRNDSNTTTGGEDASFSCTLDKWVRIVRGGTF